MAKLDKMVYFYDIFFSVEIGISSIPVLVFDWDRGLELSYWQSS